MKFGIIGFGKMGQAIAKAIINNPVIENIFIADAYEPALKAVVHEKLVPSTSIDVFNKSDIIMISTKPQDFLDLKEITKDREEKYQDKIILSIMAGVKIETINDTLGMKKIVRVMPNIANLISESASAYCLSDNITEEEKNDIDKLLNACGTAINTTENLMDAVTGVSGSGPAYVAYLIQSLADAGTKNGLSEQDSYKLALQTFYGTSKMMKELNIKPDELIAMVSSKKGTTEAGMNYLKSTEVKDIINKTVETAKNRSIELGK